MRSFFAPSWRLAWLLLLLGTALGACREAEPTSVLPAPAVDNPSDAAAGNGPGGGNDSSATLAPASDQASVRRDPPEAATSTLGTRLWVTIGDPVITGTTQAEGSLTVALFGPDGRAKGRGRSRAGYDPGDFEVALTADEDEDVQPAFGDWLEVTDAKSAVLAEFPLPQLLMQFDRPAGLVSGSADAGTSLELTVFSKDRETTLWSGSAVADTTNRFNFEPVTGLAVTGGPVSTGGTGSTYGTATTHDGASTDRAASPDGIALTGGLPIALVAKLPVGHVLSVGRKVPYVRASIHPGDISGSARPLSPVTVTVYATNGDARGSGVTTADADGRFSTFARDKTGRRVRPLGGDRVVQADAEGELTVPMPMLTADANLPANQLFGQGTATRPISITLWNPWYPGESDDPAAMVGKAGAWTVAPKVAVHPGSHYYITEYEATGDEVFFCRQVPILHVQPGSPMVRVETLVDINADLTLVRNGQSVASATGGGTWSGDVELVLKDPSGAPVAVQPGDALQAVLDGTSSQMTVTPLAASVDGTTGRLIGTAPPGVTLTLATTSPLLDSATRAAADGSFSILIPEDLLVNGGPRPGARFEVYYRTPERSNIRSLFLGPSLEVNLVSATVRGTLMPGTAGSLSRTARDGRLIATIPVTADPTGHFTERLDPAPPSLAPGERLTLSAGPLGAQGTVTTALTLPDLDVERDPEQDRLYGTGPANGLLEIQAFVGESEVADRLTAFIDADGHWSATLAGRPSGLADVDASAVRRFDVVLQEDANSVVLSVQGQGGR